MPFGQVPVLEVDGKQLPQTHAIARYLGRKFGLSGKTDFDKAWVDAVADQLKDYLHEIRPYIMAVNGVTDGDVNLIMHH
uniref:glutathione transferase n=1 Tax=Heterorhabditis bacteriophora TaxID=37862 RepID=A0A1I7XEN3_HETBA